ncbi:MAG: hypothetical protein R2849_09360 [Thermomicrobiales bacterium]
MIVTGLPAGEIGDGSRSRRVRLGSPGSDGGERFGCLHRPGRRDRRHEHVPGRDRRVHSGLYKFGSYRSAESGADVERLVFVGDETPEASDGVRIGQAMAAGVYLARDM